MATISVYKPGVTHYTRTNAKVPYVAEWHVDFAKTAVASGDVVEVLYLPAGTVVLFAGAEVTDKTSTATTFTVGTGADSDKYVSAGNAQTEGFSTPASTATDLEFVRSGSETIDITVTGAPTEGRVRIFAILASVEEVPGAGIAKVGS